MNRNVAKRIRNGTIASNVFVGVCTRRTPPINPPRRLTGTKSFNHGTMVPILLRYPMVPPNVAGRRAIVLVAFAGTDGMPTEIRAGNVTKVPPPAMEFMIPATHPARARTNAWMMSN